MPLLFRILACVFTCVVVGSTLWAQPGAWHSPLKQPLPRAAFGNYGVCITYQTDSFVYFAVSQNATPSHLKIYAFSGDSMKLMLQDTSGSLTMNTRDKLIRYKGSFYILTVNFENAGTTDTSGHFYKWNGNSWKPQVNTVYFDKTGSGFVSVIEYKDNLYLGGGFDSINGLNMNHVARYDGSTFSPVIYGGFTGTSHYAVLTLANDTMNVYGEGSYAAFTTTGWHWRNKSMNFYFYENFMLSGYQHFISVQTGNLIVQRWQTMYLSGMSVPGTSSSGQRSGLVVHNGNLYAYLDSTYKISGIDYNVPKGLYLHNQKNKWLSIPTSTLSMPGVYDYYAGTKLLSFKGKMYVYGHIDTLNNKGDTLRFIALFSSPYARVSGRIYHDADSNCRRGGSEKLLKGRVVEALPGSYYCSTDDSGRFAIDLPYGNYRLSVVDKNYWSPNSCDTTISISVKDTTAIDTLSLGQWQMPLNDLAVSITGNTGYRARRGFHEGYHLSLTNVGYQTKNTSLSLTYPAELTNFSCTPAATSHSGNVVQWSLTNIAPGETREISFYLTVDTSNLKLGDKLSFTCQLQAPPDDVNNRNNTDTLRQKVVSSLDPNEKQVYPFSNDSITTINPGTTELEYTIHFENLGNDTAYKVVILDTVSINLNVKQIEQTGTSHQANLTVLPCNPDFGRCVLRWTFDNIKLPHKPKSAGAEFTDNRGHVSYKITTVEGLPLGTSILNHADIYFDFNSPVTTNTVVIKVDTTSVAIAVSPVNKGFAPAFTAWPNPAGPMLEVHSLDNETLILTDLAGRVRMQLHMPAHSTRLWCIEHLPPGIYLLSGTNGKGALKIVKY